MCLLWITLPFEGVPEGVTRDKVSYFHNSVNGYFPCLLSLCSQKDASLITWAGCETCKITSSYEHQRAKEYKTSLGSLYVLLAKIPSSDSQLNSLILTGWTFSIKEEASFFPIVDLGAVSFPPFTSCIISGKLLNVCNSISLPVKCSRFLVIVRIKWGNICKMLRIEPTHSKYIINISYYINQNSGPQI